MRLEYLSMQSQRSGAYLSAAFALVAVIPLLCVVTVMLSLHTDHLPDLAVLQHGTALGGLVSMVLGYCLLRVYPRNLLRLRNYLEQMAAEQFPENAKLLPGELDMHLVEYSLNKVIRQLQDKIRLLDRALTQSRMMIQTIEVQSGEIMEAERQRVMIASVGAACHHISQPTTILTLYLTQLRDLDAATFTQHNLAPCLDAVDEIARILRKLKAISEYRTVPYVAQRYNDETGQMEDVQILDIESPSEHV